MPAQCRSMGASGAKMDMSHITVHAKPNAKEDRVEQIDPEHFSVSVKAPPVQGRANEAIVKLLAEHFAVAPSRVRIVRGYASREKWVEIV